MGTYLFSAVRYCSLINSLSRIDLGCATMKWVKKERIVVIDVVRGRNGELEQVGAETDDRVGSKAERKYFAVMPVDGLEKVFYRSRWDWETYRK